MKIPFDSAFESLNLTYTKSSELLDDYKRISELGEEEFYNYITDNIHKVVENSKERTRLTFALNKIDDLLEKNVNEYIALVASTPQVLASHKAQIDEYHRKFTSMLIILFKKKVKINQ